MAKTPLLKQPSISERYYYDLDRSIVPDDGYLGLVAIILPGRDMYVVNDHYELGNCSGPRIVVAGDENVLSRESFFRTIDQLAQKIRNVHPVEKAYEELIHSLARNNNQDVLYAMFIGNGNTLVYAPNMLFSRTKKSPIKPTNQEPETQLEYLKRAE